jgi:hypothetical protein
MLTWTLFLVLVCGTRTQKFVRIFQLHPVQNKELTWGEGDLDFILLRIIPRLLGLAEENIKHIVLFASCHSPLVGPTHNA